MRRTKYGAAIEYSGPFFEKDPVKTFRGNLRGLVESLAQDGERMVKAELPRSAEAPHYADHVIGRAKALKGKSWRMSAVVTGTLHLESKNFKGYGGVIETNETFQRRSASGSLYTVAGFGKWVYRRVGQALRRSVRVSTWDLTKGL